MNEDKLMSIFSSLKATVYPVIKSLFALDIRDPILVVIEGWHSSKIYIIVFHERQTMETAEMPHY
jgi:hypothetical protein